MPRDNLSTQLKERMQKALFSYAFFRLENALVIALTIIMTGLSALDLPWLPIPWWIWPIFGLIGVALIILTTVKDPHVHRQLMDGLFRESFDLGKLSSSDLRQQLNKALEYRKLVFEEIEREADPVLDDYLLDMARSLEDWIAQMYHLARGLDAYRRDPIIERDLKSVPKELEAFKVRLASEKNPVVREELEKTLATKRAQWETLRKLRETMAKAQLQLDNTLANMGNVYMQVLLLGAKDVDSSRAKRLQADMSEQVLALQDVNAAMDEVYHQSSTR